MFWRYSGYPSVCTLDTLLENGDHTLEELLDESDLIQELKQHHTKLVLYFCNAKVLERLLEFVVAPRLEPVHDEATDSESKGKEWHYFKTRAQKSDEDVKNKQRNRHAYVAAEILSSDNWSIYESLLENQNLLRKFWDFLKLSPPLDPLQASYFTKVNEALLDKKTEEMLDLFKSLDGAVKNMLRHVESPMIMDLLLKIISLEKAEGGKGIVDWLHRQDIIPSLLTFLSPEHSAASQTSAGDFLKAIITISANTSQNQQSCVGPNELTRQLVSKPYVEQLISYMLRGGNSLTVGVGIVIEVIRKNNSDYDPYISTEDCTPSSGDPIYLGTLLRLFAQKVPEFMTLMLNPTTRSGEGSDPGKPKRIKTAFGEEIEPLGFERFKICELMAELLHCSNMGLLNESDSEEIIRRRDAERERLRVEGKLRTYPEEPSATDFKVDENKRLQVQNASDDDGFERVSHSDDEEVDFKNIHPTSSTERSDELFLDRPSSSNLKISELLEPEMTVQPLSPSKDIQSLEISDKCQGTGIEEITKFSLTLDDENDVVDGNEEVNSLKEPTNIVNPEPQKKKGSTEDLSKENLDTRIIEKINTYNEQVANTSQPEDIVKSTSKNNSDILGYPEDKPAPLTLKKINAVDSNNDATSTRKNIQPDVSLNQAQKFIEETDDFKTKANDSDIITDYPTVGDFLKMQFVKYKVVPTILDFFFCFSWNNFLHNVVYDVVQQVFNGPMDRGFNRTLAFDLFETGNITKKIVYGQKKSDQMTKMRLGYMGHLTLIAEEVVKFTERHPPQLFPDSVLRSVMDCEWILYVEITLTETRERDNAILGGYRPVKPIGQRQAVPNTDGNFGCALVQASLNGNFGSALTEAGLNEAKSNNEDTEMAGAEVGFSVPLAPTLDKFDDEEVDYEYFEKLDRETPLFPGGHITDITPPAALPPPALHIPPSRARRQLAVMLALHKVEKGNSDNELGENDKEVLSTIEAEKRTSLDDDEFDSMVPTE